MKPLWSVPGVVSIPEDLRFVSSWSSAVFLFFSGHFYHYIFIWGHKFTRCPWSSQTIIWFGYESFFITWPKNGNKLLLSIPYPVLWSEMFFSFCPGFNGLGRALMIFSLLPLTVLSSGDSGPEFESVEPWKVSILHILSLPSTEDHHVTQIKHLSWLGSLYFKVH